MIERAEWIWDKMEEEARNIWKAFRGETTLWAAPKSARLEITADARYCLLINGKWVGGGPQRHYPDTVPFDTYDITRLLRPGKNIIGALVHYYGFGTMSHPLAEPGLLISLEITEERKNVTLQSGRDFLVKDFPAFMSSSPRACVQQHFTEHIDGRLWEDFTHPDYIPNGWRQPLVSQTKRPTLTKRNMPFMTDEPQFARCVSRLRSVRPLKHSYVVDHKQLFVPGWHKCCNPHDLRGFVVFGLRLEEPGEVRLHMENHLQFPVCAVGRWWGREDCFGGRFPLLPLALPAGEHLITFDVTRPEHWDGLHFGLDTDVPVELTAPGGADWETPFGVLAFMEASEEEEYSAARKILPLCGLAGVPKCPVPVRADLVSPVDPLLLCSHIPEAVSHSVPASLQAAALPDENPAELPFWPGRDTEFTLDFGCETVGYLILDVEVPGGTVLDLYCYEYEKGNYIQYTWGFDSTWRYICREGRQTIRSTLRRGLRYCVVTARAVTAGSVKIYGIHVRRSTFPLAQVGEFSCSDRLLTDIWEIAARTVRLCSEDTFVDCPVYEQVFWVGDSRNESLISRYIYGGTDNIRNSLELVPHSAAQDSLLCCHLPSGWDSVIPNWTFFWMLACGEHYQYSQDTAFLEGILPAVLAAADAYLSHLDSRGLLSLDAWNLLDWAPMDQPNSGVVAHQNMFFVKTLRAAAAMLRDAGRADEAHAREEAAGGLRKAILDHLWDEGRGAFSDCLRPDGERSPVFSVQTQVCALLCEICEDGEQINRVKAHLLCPPPDFVRVGSPFMSFFLYEVWEEQGHWEEILRDMRQNYGDMIRHGATTCWEQYASSPLNKSEEGMLSRSHCHAWSAAPGYFLPRLALGIRPEGPGWIRVRISPRPCQITWAYGAVPHPKGGVIRVDYTVEEDIIRLRLEVPEGVEPVFDPPPGYRMETQTVRTVS